MHNESGHRRNLSIAEWPTDHGPADYVLFARLTPLAGGNGDVIRLQLT